MEGNIMLENFTVWTMLGEMLFMYLICFYVFKMYERESKQRKQEIMEKIKRGELDG